MKSTEANQPRRPKTSYDIPHERDALGARLRDVEGALASADEEVQHALRHPEIAYLALCRLAVLLRHARLTRNW